MDRDPRGFGKVARMDLASALGTNANNGGVQRAAAFELIVSRTISAASLQRMVSARVLVI